MQEKRIENSLRNSFYGAIRMVVLLLFRFVIRTVIIKILGEEFLGLDSLFASILQILSLAELGIGSAIGFALYKPMAEKNAQEISNYLKIYKKIYTVIALIILAAGLIATPFLSHLISGDPPEGTNIYVIFLILLTNTVLGYFISYKRTLLFADQRNDIETKIGTISIVFMYSLQIGLLFLTKNYYIYIAIMPFATIIENIIVSAVVNKKYRQLFAIKPLPLNKVKKKELFKYTRAIMFHKLGGVLVFSTDNIIISAFLGLAVVGLYNNYYFLITSVVGFLTMIVKSLTASIGNSIVKESVNKNHKNFIQLTFFNFWIMGICAACFLSLFQPFMLVWVGQSALLPITIPIALTASFFLNQSRSIVNAYKDVTGTFYHDRYKPILEGGLNLILSLVFVNLMGLVGVILGTILSYILVAIPIETYVLYKNYFKKNVWFYFLRAFVYSLICAGAVVLTYYVVGFIPLSGISGLIVKMIIAFCVPNVLFVLLSFWTQEFQYFKSVFGRIFSLKPRGKQRVEKGDVMVNDTLEDIKKIQLQILIEFDRVCRKNGINYSLDSGTLLGAVRHKGFIPWDDDIDVILNRENFNKFLAICNIDLLPRYKLIHYTKDKFTPLSFAKLIDTNTNLIEEGNRNLKTQDGIFIDIFIADRVVNEPKKLNAFIKKLKFINLLKFSYKDAIRMSQNKGVKILKTFLIPVNKMAGLAYFNKKENKILQTFSSDKTADFTFGSAVYVPKLLNQTKLVPYALFENYDEIEFEGFQFMSIQKKEDYLTALYGNYMQLPPEEKRVSVHYFIYVNCFKHLTRKELKEQKLI